MYYMETALGQYARLSPLQVKKLFTLKRMPMLLIKMLTMSSSGVAVFPNSNRGGGGHAGGLPHRCHLLQRHHGLLHHLCGGQFPRHNRGVAMDLLRRLVGRRRELQNSKTVHQRLGGSGCDQTCQVENFKATPKRSRVSLNYIKTIENCSQMIPR